MEERQSPREWGKEEEERDRDPMIAMVVGGHGVCHCAAPPQGNVADLAGGEAP